MPSAWSASLLAAAGCRQDMHNQPKAIPLRESMFFKDALERAAARRGHGRARHAAGRRGVLHREETARCELDALPFALTAEVLDRGEQRFNIYCTPCHGLSGERRRHDRAARLPPAAVVPHRPAAPGAARALLRRDDQRVRRDAGLSRADRAARSLGDCRLRPRPATEPARFRRGALTGRAAEAFAAGGRRRAAASTST